MGAGECEGKRLAWATASTLARALGDSECQDLGDGERGGGYTVREIYGVQSADDGNSGLC